MIVTGAHDVQRKNKSPAEAGLLLAGRRP